MNPAEFIRQVKSEAKKINWITKKELSTSTFMVVICVIVASFFFVFVDWLSYFGIKFIFSFGGV